MTRKPQPPGLTRTEASPSLAPAERGVVAIVTVLLATLLLGAAAVAVDVGNALQTQRRSQSAADAAAFAGLQSYLQDVHNDSMTEQARITKATSEAKDYADRNANITAAQWAACVDSARPPGYTSDPSTGAGTCISIRTQPSFAIRVHVPAVVATGFARVFGTSEINANATTDVNAPSTTTLPPTTTSPAAATIPPPPPNCGLYPIALSIDTVNATAIGGSMDVFNGATPGNFGWMSWTGGNSVGTLATSLTTPGDASTYTNPNDPTDHLINLGDWVWGKPGISNASSVRAALDSLISNTTTMSIPIWDNVTGNGNNTQYRIAGFALIRLSSYRLPGQNEIQATYLGPATCNGITGTAATPTTTSPPTTTEAPSCRIQLLTNGSFEAPISPGPNPSAWSYTGNVARSNAFVADGTWSAIGQATSWLHQSIPAQPAQPYRLTFYGGTHDPTQHAIVTLEFLDTASNIISSTAPFELDFNLDLPSGGVTTPYPTAYLNTATGPIGGPYTITMTAPPLSTQVRISLHTTGADYSKLDNVSLVRC